MKKKYLELCRNMQREKANFNNLLLTLMNMFVYKGIPKEWRFKQDIERILIMNGRIGYNILADGKKVYFPMSWCGDIAWDGRGEKYMGTTLGGTYVFNEVESDTGAWGYNNSLGFSDTELFRYSEMLSQIDLSMDRNVKFARLNPILGAKNDVVKTKLDELMDNIMNGDKLQTVVNDNLIRDFEQKLIEVYHVTDVKDIDKLQYLSRFYEDIERRFYTLYGIPIQMTNKLAQTNDSEIHSHDKQSTIIALDRLRCRKEMCERMSTFFDTEITVEFSEPWQWINDYNNEESEVDADVNIERVD